MKIKAVLFDLDGTLFQYVPTSGETFLERLREMGFRITKEQRAQAERWVHYYFAYSPEIQADDKKFDGNHEAFWVNFTRRRLIAFGVPTASAAEMSPELSAYMREVYKPQIQTPQSARSLLERLKESGYILGMVSNRDAPFQEEMRQQNLDAYFEFFLAGGEINSFKPEPRIFKHALALAGTTAQETMYVGDNYYADVVGARSAGLTAVLYDPPRLFANADCAVIQCFSELPALLA